MAKKDNRAEGRSPVREQAETPAKMAAGASSQVVKVKFPEQCKECKAENAFHAWREKHLEGAFATSIYFDDAMNIPEGKRAVIELVTATVTVPAGEKALLRMYTNLGQAPSNLDLVLTPQGRFGGRDVFAATHSLRAYSDNPPQFCVARDNAQTEGDAFICISGYLVDV